MSRSKSLRQIALELGVVLSALQEARATGRITIPDSGEVDIEAIRAQWLASTNTQGPAPLAERAAPAHAEIGGESLADARRRKEVAIANMKELELQREMGLLIPVAGVEREVGEYIASCRTKLLSLPTFMKQQLPHLTLTDIAEFEKAIRQTLTELSEGNQRPMTKEET